MNPPTMTPMRPESAMFPDQALNRHRLQVRCLSLALCTLMTSSLLPSTGQAKVSAEEAKQLGTTLMPLGGERRASTSGWVPAWEGGLHTPPAHYGGPGSFHPDPFDKESPIAIISPDNQKAYASLLSPAHKALLEHFPESFQIHLFPSHRTHAAPQWLYENTRKNAVAAELTEDGNGLKQVLGGVPFPIPQNGTEVVWNHLTRWRGKLLRRDEAEAVVFKNGTHKLVISDLEVTFNYYRPRNRPEDYNDILLYYISVIKSPPALAGGAFLLIDPVNQLTTPRQTWGYNNGQRRVRRIPHISYDSPALVAESVRTTDDTDMFNGSPDRFDWQILGKQEMIVPYSCYRMGLPEVSYDQLLTPGHLAPEFIRNEVHRVWVVEGRLKNGKSHVYRRRTLYIDEDSWGILIAENYDHEDQLWRVGFSHTRQVYEVPGVMPFADAFYDLKTGLYNVKGMQNHASQSGIFSDDMPDPEYYSPATLRARGHR